MDGSGSPLESTLALDFSFDEEGESKMTSDMPWGRLYSISPQYEHMDLIGKIIIAIYNLDDLASTHLLTSLVWALQY